MNSPNLSGPDERHALYSLCKGSDISMTSGGFCAIETYLYLFVCGFMYWCKCISFHGATKAQLETQLTGAVLLLLWRFANTWGRGCGMRSWEPLCLPPILCLLLLRLLKSIDVQFHSMVNSKMYKCKQRTKPKDK